VSHILSQTEQDIAVDDYMKSSILTKQ